MSYRVIIWFAIVISIIILILLSWFLPSKDWTLINIVGLVGFVLSALGIVIAYVQIISIKKIAIATQQQIAASLRHHNSVLMISDLSKKGEMIQEIQGYLRDDKFDLCRLRMKDLKGILANIGNQQYYSSLVPKKEFKSVLENFHLDYRNLLTHNPNEGTRIDKILVIEHLEALSLLFLNVENQLKNRRNDT